MPTEKKDAAIALLRERIGGRANLFFTDFRGLTVGELKTLRTSLRKESVEYAVVKNTLFAIAVGDERRAALRSVLQGPTGVAFAGDDPVGAAKALVAFANDSKKLQIKAAIVDGELVDADKVTQLSRVPARPELLSKLVGSLKAPLYGIVSVFGGNQRKLLYLLDAVRALKAGSNAA